MSKEMIFNPATLEMREVTQSDAERAVRELGWVKPGGANELLAIYSPRENAHKTILKKDFPIWEAKGFYAEPTIVYHPEEGSKMVSAKQAKQMIGKGWYGSPADYTDAAKEAIVNKAVKEHKAAK